MAAKKRGKKKKLTQRQRRFVQEYLIDLNATQAAIRSGYSPRAAEVQGSRLLRYAQVAEAVSKAIAKRSERTGITADRVLAEYARVAFSDVLSYVSFDKSGVALNDSGKLTENQARAIAEVSENINAYGRQIKFKLHSKTEALQALGRHLKLFTDKTEHSGPDGGPIEVEGRETLLELMKDPKAADALRTLAKKTEGE